ncbi:MAG: GNAT family N-acetyltransferase [Bacteroidales bacterium]|nr:GNAT family N-acetyltransferase [Bacteroidales bacterium]
MMENSDYARMSDFSCGIEVLDNFFRCEVENCIRKKYLAAYCAELPDGKIVAAFTLMNDAIMISSNSERNDFISDLFFEADADIVEFLKRQSSFPAINIGHLGTLTDYQNHGIGTSIIDFLAETYACYRQSGCQFLTVDALNNLRTIDFYKDNGFSFQTNKDFYSPTRRMYRIL